MKKKSLIFFVVLLGSMTLFAQDVKKDAENVKTKMDLFSSKTGSITKYTDYKLPLLATRYGGNETRIRRILNGVNSAYFYQIEKEGKYSNSTASIEYNDLLEVVKALNALISEVDKDIATNPDYLENKFITVDGFQVGYFVSEGKASWYLKLEKYGSDNSLFIDNVNTIVTAFAAAKSKIEELKNK